MAKMNVKTGDKVVVLSGKDKGKEGQVIRALPAEGKVVVEGVAVVKKAVRPNAQNQQGGFVQKEAAIDVSQRHAGLPQVRQAHARRPRRQRQGRQGPRLQEVRRPVLRA